MSEKNYNFENFEEPITYGKHFKQNNENDFSEKDNFDFEDKNITPAPVVEETNDYGDDFYTEEEAIVIDSYPKRRETAQPYAPAPVKKTRADEIQKKNTTIVILTVALVLVVFSVLLFIIFSSLSKNDSKEPQTPTNAITTPTQVITDEPTEEKTEATEEETTEEPTEEETEAPTEAPTETPTEAPTDAPTDAPTEAEV